MIMKLYYVPALVVLAIPTVVDGYCGGGLPRNLFASPMVVYTPGAMMRRQRALANQIYRRPRSSPRYEITDTDEAFQLAVDVPGVAANDINVSIENDMLTLSGERKMDKDSYSFASKFYQSFNLDPAIEVDQITAELKNGVLYVVAPKNLKRIEDNVKRIPIKQVTENETVETKETLGDEQDEMEVKASQVDSAEPPNQDEEEEHDQEDLDEKQE